MLLIAAPGQGAQTPGFLSPWLELPGVTEQLAAWSDLVGCDLITLGTTGTQDEIRDTAVAQPLLVAAALAAARTLSLGPDDTLAGHITVAGHSVGELAAGALAGIVTPADALTLVGVRAEAMAKASAVTPTSMTAILGGDEADVLARIEACGLTPANINGAGQIVAAGTVEQLAAFAADPPARTRLRSLQVAGAFHTSHMAPAVDALRAASASVKVSDPALAVLSNRDGAVVRSGTDWLERIITQVSAPVRWDLCMQAMSDLAITAFLELPPAGALVGLAKRALPGVALLGLKTPQDLADAKALLAEHADVHPDSHAPDWRLLVAPLAGTFRLGADFGGPGTTIVRGAELGRVQMRGGEHPVASDFPATIIEWLVEDGDPVSAGQPLIRLQPSGTD
jgi:[acyl-carrier-protein] S-malonyltransferase